MLAPVAEPAARRAARLGGDAGAVLSTTNGQRERADVAGHVGDAHVELVRPVRQEPRVDPGLARFGGERRPSSAIVSESIVPASITCSRGG